MFRPLLVLAASAFLTIPQLAHATSSFTDSASFLAAIGGSADLTVDFNEFAVDTTFLNTTVDAGAISLSASGTFENRIDDGNVFGFLLDETSYAHIFATTSGTTATMTFDDPVTAFGATIANMNPGTIWSLTTSSGIESFSGVGVSSTTFYGFVLDPGVTLESITFSVLPTGVSDAFGLDNVLLAVPEPSVGVLLGLGLASLVIGRRRRTG